MNAMLMKLRAWWVSRRASERRILAVTVVLLGVLGFGFSSASIRLEQDKLRRAIPNANAALLQMQDDATEVDRLRGQSPVAPLQGQVLTGALTASLRSHGLNLSLTSEGTDRFRAQGRVGFDQAIAWLAAVQRDYQLRVATLAVTRQDGGVTLDAVLIPNTQ